MAERTLPKNGELRNSFAYQHWKYRSLNYLRNNCARFLFSTGGYLFLLKNRVFF